MNALAFGNCGTKTANGIVGSSVSVGFGPLPTCGTCGAAVSVDDGAALGAAEASFDAMRTKASPTAVRIFTLVLTTYGVEFAVSQIGSGGDTDTRTIDPYDRGARRRIAPVRRT